MSPSDRDDLRPFPPERPRPRRGPGGEADRPHGAGDRGDIGEHVSGVGQQGQRPGRHRDDDLDEHEPDQQHQREQQVAPVRARADAMPVALARVPVSVIPAAVIRAVLIRAVQSRADRLGRLGCCAR